MRITPFDPPTFAPYGSQQAYGYLRRICMKPSEAVIDSDEVFRLIRPTYYNVMDFVSVRTERELCKKLIDLHWWEIHGANVNAIIWGGAICIIVMFTIWLALRLRHKVGDAAIVGLATGVRAKRLAAESFERLGQKIRDRADRDGSN